VSGSVVQSAIGINSAFATAIATFGGSTTAGNLLVACCTYYQKTQFSSVSDSVGGGAGNSWVDAAAEVQGVQIGGRQQYAKNISNAGASHTVTLTISAANYPDIIAYEISGEDTTAPLDQQDSTTVASTTTPVGNNKNVMASGIAIAHGCDDTLLLTSFTMGAPWSVADKEQDHTGSNIGIVAGHQSVTVGGNPYHSAFTMNTARAAIIFMSTYKDAAAADTLFSQSCM